MFRRLLCDAKLTTLPVIAGHRFGKRFLSANETAAALRPFIFTVHPDLFCQHPKEQAINEESLKQLNEYINQLHSKNRVKPLALTFYVRWPSDPPVANDNFRPVNIRLAAQSLIEAVRIVLSSCGLPLDYIERHSTSTVSAKSNNAYSGDMSRGDFTNNVDSCIITRFYGAHAYDQSPIRMRRMARNTVCEWLQKNVDRARRNCLQTAAVQNEITKLKEMITQETGVTDIQWQCNWTSPSFRTALRGLLRVCRQHSSEISLKGRTVVFGTDMGVCIQGHVILRHEDVADNWIVTLRTLAEHDAHLHRIPTAERYLSSLLGNAQIARQPHHPVIMVNDYLSQIHKLTDSVRELINEGGETVNVSLEGVQLVIVCAAGSLMVSQCGQILIPTSCPAFLVVDFINRHAAEAKLIREQYLTSEKAYIELVQQCYKALGVESLIKDPNISRAQMESCCVRLLKLRELGTLDVDLTMCRLKVAQFYSVMSDGEICIPWKFEDVV